MSGFFASQKNPTYAKMKIFVGWVLCEAKIPPSGASQPPKFTHQSENLTKRVGWVLCEAKIPPSGAT